MENAMSTGVPNSLLKTSQEATALASTSRQATPTPQAVVPRPVALPQAAGQPQNVTALRPATDTQQHAVPEKVVCKIPNGVTFKGEASYPCDVLVQGSFQGQLTATTGQTVTIAGTGSVEGHVRAANIRVDGQADGKLEAPGGLVRFGPQSKCTGEVLSGRLAIDEGAEVEATTKRVL